MNVRILTLVLLFAVVLLDLTEAHGGRGCRGHHSADS